MLQAVDFNEYSLFVRIPRESFYKHASWNKIIITGLTCDYTSYQFIACRINFKAQHAKYLI